MFVLDSFSNSPNSKALSALLGASCVQRLRLQLRSGVELPFHESNIMPFRFYTVLSKTLFTHAEPKACVDSLPKGWSMTREVKNEIADVRTTESDRRTSIDVKHSIATAEERIEYVRHFENGMHALQFKTWTCLHTSTLLLTIPPVPTCSRRIQLVGRRERRRSTTTAVRETAAAFSHFTASRRVLGIHAVHQRWFPAHVWLGYFQASCSEIPSVSPTPPHPIHQGPCGPSKDRGTWERRGGTRTASGAVPGFG